MRVNVYAEEITRRVEMVRKTVDGIEFTGLRLYLYLPVSTPGGNIAGPFKHSADDDDSAAITFWGKDAMATVLTRMLGLLITDRDSNVRKYAIDAMSRELGILVKDYGEMLTRFTNIPVQEGGQKNG